MTEIIAFIYFIRKIKHIANEKGIEAKAWIWKFVFRWLLVEYGVMIVIMNLYNIEIVAGIEIEKILLIIIPSLGLALASAFYTIRQLKEQEDHIELDDNNQNFDHFR